MAPNPVDPWDVVVVGAGVSGLAYAHERLRAEPTARVLVLEASGRAGGLAHTRTQEGFRFEEGPEALPGNARSVRGLCETLGLAVHEAPATASRRYLQQGGKLIEVPGSPEDLATSRVLSIGAKMRLMAEAACARDKALDGSIADFARHRFGQEALDKVVDPLVAGIHAGDPEQLSLRACFPEVARMVEEHGSITAAMAARAKARKPGQPRTTLGGGLFKPAGGMAVLTRALADSLGEHLRTETPVQAVERAPEGFRVREGSGTVHDARRVVLATPLARARELLAGCAPAAAEALASMRAENLVSVIHAWRREQVTHPLDGFGYLVPKSAGGFVLGTLFSSALDPAAAPPGTVLLRSLVGGARRPEAPDLGDAELLDSVTSECAGPLGLAGTPLFTCVARYRSVIPRFDLEHLERRARLAAGLPAGLHVLGNFTEGLGLEKLVSQAQALARAS